MYMRNGREPLYLVKQIWPHGETLKPDQTADDSLANGARFWSVYYKYPHPPADPRSRVCIGARISLKQIYDQYRNLGINS